MHQIMSMRCELTGKSSQTGNNVSHAKNRTKRKFKPNLQNISFSSEVLGQKLFNVRLAFGGMAAIPKRALNAEKVLEGKKFDVALFKLAQLALEKDFSPISDMRASNKYRMRVAKNLLLKCCYDYSNYEEAT